MAHLFPMIVSCSMSDVNIWEQNSADFVLKKHCDGDIESFWFSVTSNAFWP